MVDDLAEYRWSSFLYHGMGQDDPLLSPFPQWEGLGRTEAERRRRWRTKLRARQSEAELMSVRTSVCSGRPFGEADWTKQMSERLKIELSPRPRGRPPKKIT
jgi:hypothetical protein